MYNRWVPTEPVELPIDTYMKAGMYAEQKSEQNLKNLGDIFGAYSSVQAASPNAQAYYDEAFKELETEIGNISKMNLKTPEANRKFLQAVSNPNVSKKIMNVYKDFLNVQKAKTALAENAKDNPPDNAYEYYEALYKLQNEPTAGDSKAFDPYRMANLKPITKYFDLYDAVSKEVNSLKADKARLKEIVGQYYHVTEEGGVSEERIRNVAMHRVLQDPLARAQFDRSLKYRAFTVSPDGTVAGGIQYMGNAIKTDLQKRLVDLDGLYKTSLDEINAMKINPDTDKPITKAEKEKAIGLLNRMYDQKKKNYSELLSLDNQDLYYQQELDKFAEGFTSRRTKDTVEEWSFNEKYTADRADARDARRIAAQKKMMQDFMRENSYAPSPVNLPLIQKDIGPSGWNNVIKSNDPNGLLGNVVLDKNGTFSIDNYNDLFEIKQKGLALKGKYVNPANIIRITPDKNGNVPKEKIKDLIPVGTDISSGGGTGGGWASVNSYLYIKKGTPVFDTKEKGASAAFEDAKKQIKSFVNKNAISQDGFTETLKDGRIVFNYQKAIAAIANNMVENERTFMQGWRSPQSTSPNFIDDVHTRLVTSGGWDEKGNELTPKERAAISEMYYDNKSGARQILDVPYLPFANGPVNAVVVGGRTYYVPMDIGNALAIQPATLAMENAYKSNTLGSGLSTLGNDIIVRKLGPDGRTAVIVNPGAASVENQKALQGIYMSNIDKLKKEGNLSGIEAEEYLLNNARKIENDIYSNKEHKAVLPNGKTVILNSAVSKEQYGSNSDLYFGTRININGKTVDLNIPHSNYVEDMMTNFADPYRNVWQRFYSRTMMGSKDFNSNSRTASRLNYILDNSD